MNKQEARQLGFLLAKRLPAVDVGTVSVSWHELTGLMAKGDHEAARALLYNSLKHNVDWLQRVAANIRIEVSELNKELISHLAQKPEALRSVSPKEFEKVIFEILLDRGYDVQMTPMSRDGGRDILAFFKSPTGGEVLTIVECKRWKPERKVGLAVVERFLYVLNEKDKASYGVIATTSFFSTDAKAAAKQWKQKLKLRDFDDMAKWMAKYGKWKNAENAGLWTPSAADI